MSAELTGVTNVGNELQNLSLSAHMPRDDEQYMPVYRTSGQVSLKRDRFGIGRRHDARR
jgi:hypothetical protein